MNPEIQEKISQAIDNLANSLGIAAQHLYEVFARQIFFEGVVYGLTSLVVSIALFVGAFFAFKIVKLGFKEYSFDLQMVGGIAVFALSLLGFLVFTEIPENALKIANPEYYIVERVSDLIRGE